MKHLASLPQIVLLQPPGRAFINHASSCLRCNHARAFLFGEHPAPARALSGSSNPPMENEDHLGQDLVRNHRGSLRSCESARSDLTFWSRSVHVNADLIANMTHNLSFNADGKCTPKFYLPSYSWVLTATLALALQFL